MNVELNDIQEVFHYYDSRGDNRIFVHQAFFFTARKFFIEGAGGSILEKKLFLGV